MFGFVPTITPDDHLLIVSYVGADIKSYKNTYILPVANITVLIDEQHNIPTKWTKLTLVDHYNVAPVPKSYVVVGGIDIGKTSTADIKMYDHSNRSWKKIGSLSFARAKAAVTTVYDNTIIIIGGCTKADTFASTNSSSMTIVELGQAELLH